MRAFSPEIAWRSQPLDCELARLPHRWRLEQYSCIHPPSLLSQHHLDRLSPPPPLRRARHRHRRRPSSLRPRLPRVPRRAHVRADEQHPAAHPTSNTRAYFAPCSTARSLPSPRLVAQLPRLRCVFPCQPATPGQERADRELVTALVPPPARHANARSHASKQAGRQSFHKPDHRSLHRRRPGLFPVYSDRALPIDTQHCLFFSLTERAYYLPSSAYCVIGAGIATDHTWQTVCNAARAGI